MNISNRLHSLLRPILLIPIIALGLLSIIATGGGGGGNGNQPPTAVFFATPNSGDAPLLVAVDASGSSDSDGNITSYAWDFGNGGSGSGVTASNTYNNPGNYTITLTVTDDAGDIGTATTTISVGPSSGAAKHIDQQILEKYGHIMSSMSHILVYQAGEAAVIGNVESSNHALFLIAGETLPPGEMVSSSHVLQGGFYIQTP
jgi:PKD repeat protein